MPIPYDGKFTVEVWRGASLKHVPQIDGVVVDGNVIKVNRGRVASIGLGGIQFYAGGELFAWGYEYIRHILDADGRCIWHNRDDALHEPVRFSVTHGNSSDKSRVSLAIRYREINLVLKDISLASAKDLIMLIDRIAGGHIVVEGP